jgi:hypothetical protein
MDSRSHRDHHTCVYAEVSESLLQDLYRP